MSARKRNAPVRDHGDVPMQLLGEEPQSLKGDRGNIALLLFLYVLQGIPLGLIAAVPLLLQNRSVSYREQAQFSLAYWPFSLKLFWAPIVDSCYIHHMGRRKTWLVPTQYLLGFFLLYLSSHVDEYLEGSNGKPNIGILTALFFALNFLAATQDIAVDGWALTMLKRQNVGYASTCNSVGQTGGYFLGYVLFMALESANFCNTYLRSEPQSQGLVSLPGFLYFWAIIFLVTTTLVWFLKRESSSSFASDEPDLGIIESYRLLWKILLLPNIKIMLIFLMTCKIGFAATDSVTGLKLIEAGIPKDKLALLAVPMVPLQIMLPLVISKYTAGPKPMSVFLKAMPYRLLFGLLFAGVVWWTPSFKTADNQYPQHYYLLILVCYALHQVALYSMFVAVMAFFARVSDPAVGGTYMTLLNTVCNLGGNWPSTLALWLVDPLTQKECPPEGDCVTTVDGYYIESVACVIIGFVWLRWGHRAMTRLQNLPESTWRVVK